MDQNLFCGFSAAAGSYLLALCKSAEKVYNIPASDLLQTISLTPEILEDNKKTVPVFYLYSVIVHLIKATQDDMIGFKLAQHFDLKAFDTLGYLLMHCDTIGEGLQRLQKFERLALEHSETSIVTKENITQVSWSCSYNNPGIRYFRELIITGWIAMVNRMTSQKIYCKEVHFKHSLPLPNKENSAETILAEYKSFFGCQVYFDSNWSGVCFEKHYLKTPYGRSDPRLRAIMEEYAELMLSELNSQTNFLKAARLTLFKMILNGETHFETFSDQMCLSTRALQARFKKIGVTYGDLLDEIRKMLALIYLEDPNIALIEIAILLAYNDKSSFTRAFKRWTGDTPNQYRARLIELESIFPEQDQEVKTLSNCHFDEPSIQESHYHDPKTVEQPDHLNALFSPEFS